MSTEIRSRWSELGDELKDTSRKVMLAGLGVLATADEKGREAFADLVDRGEGYRKPDREAMERHWRKSGDELKNFGQRVGDGLEKRMSTAIERFGIPSHREVRTLIDRVEQLTEKVELLAHG